MGEEGRDESESGSGRSDSLPSGSEPWLGGSSDGGEPGARCSGKPSGSGPEDLMTSSTLKLSSFKFSLKICASRMLLLKEGDTGLHPMRMRVVA